MKTNNKGASPSGPGHSAKPEPEVSAQGASVPSAEWIEFRTDDRGEFDEICAAFADGSVHVEMMDDNSCYVGFYWDDGRYCQWWFGARGKLWHNHEHGTGEPPRYTAQGVDTKPYLPDYGALAASAIEAGTGETGTGSTRSAKARPDAQDGDA